MFRFAPVKWSPVEMDYLKKHKDDPINQLTIALGKSINAVKNKLYELKHGKPKVSYSKTNKGTKIGKRKDLGLFLRSGWEANTLRYLKHEGYLSIAYEPEVFTFTQFGIKRGTIHYVPDFKVNDYKKKGDYSWFEVKGFLKQEDKVKLKRFKKYFPNEFEKLIAICGNEKTVTHKFFKILGVKEIIDYTELEKKYKDKIPAWE